jgi:hypothetical protein
VLAPSSSREVQHAAEEHQREEGQEPQDRAAFG